MSLYDGLYDDPGKSKDQELKKDVAGWSSGIKLLQSQLQLKRAALTTQNKKDQQKKSVMAPVVDLKSRKEEVEFTPVLPLDFLPRDPLESDFMGDIDWNVKDEYDPMWPNDYEKIFTELQEKKKKERDEERNRAYEERERRRRDRYERNHRDRDDDGRMRRRNDEEEDLDDRPRRSSNIGAAIAPPPSLMEIVIPMPESLDKQPTPFSSGIGGSVAAKIMAKYGFKEGQGLGKKEQGMSQALQVEKTSKRGGKIIHEKDIPKDMPPPMAPPPQLPSGVVDTTNSIIDTMRNPSKVVLLQNMVGPGEVDDDLEPETSEECSKYGEVTRCVVYELKGPQVPEEDAVRIFVEFKRIESAIKAVVDLNGRYFGGRVVSAGFYNRDKFDKNDLA